VKIRCEICGIEFLRKPSQAKKRKNHYCSIVCANKGSRLLVPRVKVICDTCGREFLRKPEHAKRSERNYCSVECYNPHRKRTALVVICCACKKEFVKPLSKVRRSKNHYCSNDCSDVGKHLATHRYDASGTLLERKCGKCQKWLTPASFGYDGQSKSKLLYSCIRCIIKSKYNLEDEQLEYLLNQTSCSVCGSKHKLGIDHNHATGKVRQRLCNNCNLAGGMANENPDILRKLAQYFEEHNKEK